MVRSWAEPPAPGRGRWAALRMPAPPFPSHSAPSQLLFSPPSFYSLPPSRLPPPFRSLGVFESWLRVSAAQGALHPQQKELSSHRLHSSLTILPKFGTVSQSTTSPLAPQRVKPAAAKVFPSSRLCHGNDGTMCWFNANYFIIFFLLKTKWADPFHLVYAWVNWEKDGWEGWLLAGCIFCSHPVLMSETFPFAHLGMHFPAHGRAGNGAKSSEGLSPIFQASIPPARHFWLTG